MQNEMGPEPGPLWVNKFRALPAAGMWLEKYLKPRLKRAVGFKSQHPAQ